MGKGVKHALGGGGGGRIGGRTGQCSGGGCGGTLFLLSSPPALSPSCPLSLMAAGEGGGGRPKFRRPTLSLPLPPPQPPPPATATSVAHHRRGLHPSSCGCDAGHDGGHGAGRWGGLCHLPPLPPPTRWPATPSHSEGTQAPGARWRAVGSLSHNWEERRETSECAAAHSLLPAARWDGTFQPNRRHQ